MLPLGVAESLTGSAMATDDKHLLTVYVDKLLSVVEGQAIAKAIMLAGVGLLLVNFAFAPEKRVGGLFTAGVVLLTLGPAIIVFAAAWRHFSQRESRRSAKAELPSVFQVDNLHPDQWAETFNMAAKGCHLRVHGIVQYRRRQEGTKDHKDAQDLGRFFGLVKRYMEHENADFEGFPTCTIWLVETDTGAPQRHILVDFSFETSPPRARVRVGFDMPPVDRLPLHRQLAKSISMIPDVSRLTGEEARFP